MAFVNYDKAIPLINSLVKEFTDCRLVMGEGAFRQEMGIIHGGSHWMEALHEFCHWLGSTKEERKQHNLGLNDNDDPDEPVTRKQLLNEIRACAIQDSLFSHFPENQDDLVSYHEYVVDCTYRLRSVLSNLNISDEACAAYFDKTAANFKKSKEYSKIVSRIKEYFMETCETCNGKKEVAISCCSGDVINDDLLMCPECYEHLGLEDCPDCNGTGEVPANKEYEYSTRGGLQTQAEALNDRP